MAEADQECWRRRKRSHGAADELNRMYRYRIGSIAVCRVRKTGRWGMGSLSCGIWQANLSHVADRCAGEG